MIDVIFKTYFCVINLTILSLNQILSQESEGGNSIPYIEIPQQNPPSPLVTNGIQPARNLNIGSDTNLISLLKQIRELTAKGDFETAQALVQSALANIELNDQNKFYLSQIRQQETKLYYELATKAMREKKFSLASQLLIVTERTFPLS